MARQFDQEQNRLDYSQLLMPAPGYELVFAVGMTYSLDLEALLSVPISLGMLEAMDDTALQNPYVLLEAIRRSSDKIAIFCNADGMSMPNQIRSVYALLENSVFCIKRNNISNFHPKMWIVQYRNDFGPDIIKVIVLSRNLTFDQSLDIAVELTGEVGGSDNPINQPLVDMLDFVQKDASKEKQLEIRKLKKAVLRVAKFDIDDQYESYRFVPIGISSKYKNSAFDLVKDARKLFVVSPFLTDSLLESIAGNIKETTLVTRARSVTKRVWDLYHNRGNKIYIVKEALLDDELLQERLENNENIAEDVKNVSHRDLHAKIYYKYSDDGKYLSLGSLNASQNAFRHNVEFMLELKFKSTRSSYNEITSDIIGGEYPAFEELTAFDGEPELIEEEEHASSFKDVVSALKYANVTHTDNGYTITIHSDAIREPAEMAPLFLVDKNNYSAMKPISDEVTFTGVTLRQLSEFYVIRRGNDVCVVKLTTEGIPYDERDTEIYNSVIGKNGFMAYIMFMLSDSYADGIASLNDYNRLLELSNNKTVNTVTPAVYEKLLRAAALEPKKIDAVEDMMKRLAPESVDQEFREMINTFKKVSGTKIKRRSIRK